MTFRTTGAAVLAALLLAAPAMTGSASAKGGQMKSVAAFDPDRDGTIDLKEAQAAGSAAFDRLDPDRDGTLDARELKGRVSRAELKQADPDGDGTLDKAEYLKLVEARFQAAEPDNDGTIDAKELKSPAGKQLLKLIK